MKKKEKLIKCKIHKNLWSKKHSGSVTKGIVTFKKGETYELPQDYVEFVEELQVKTRKKLIERIK